ncbi:MAG: ATP-binding protein [Vicinamibacterales bacterium]
MSGDERRNGPDDPMFSMGAALAPFRERLRQVMPSAVDETQAERAERLKRLPPTLDVAAKLTQFAEAARNLPAVGMIRARARIEKKLAELEEQHRQCVERDVALASLPDGCTCFGTGGIGECAFPGAEGGQYVIGWREYCACPLGQAQLAELEEIREARRAWDQARKVERALAEHMLLPERLKPFTLDSWAAETLARGNRPDVVARLVERGRAWIADPSRWLVLWGEMGVGKTGFAAGLLNGLAAPGTTVVFISAPDLLGEIRGTFGQKGGRTQEDILASAKAAPLLFLDDVGAHYTREEDGWAAEILYRLVNGRYDARAPMILTCNMRPGQRLAERLGKRAYDRLEEVADFIEVTGPSLRRPIFARTGSGYPS